MGGAPLTFIVPAVLAGALAGCHPKGGYDILLRNSTDRRIAARIEALRPGEQPLTVSTRYVDPGSRGTMLLRVERGARLSLEVSEPAPIDPAPSPARIDLLPGKTALVVRRDPESPQFRLEPAPR